VWSSHFSPGAAPQVGQRIACTFLRVLLILTVVDDATVEEEKMVNLAQFQVFNIEQTR
jgi:hypothetical protein